MVTCSQGQGSTLRTKPRLEGCSTGTTRHLYLRLSSASGQPAGIAQKIARTGVLKRPAATSNLAINSAQCRQSTLSFAAAAPVRFFDDSSRWCLLAKFGVAVWSALWQVAIPGSVQCTPAARPAPLLSSIQSALTASAAASIIMQRRRTPLGAGDTAAIVKRAVTALRAFMDEGCTPDAALPVVDFGGLP